MVTTTFTASYRQTNRVITRTHLTQPVRVKLVGVVPTSRERGEETDRDERGGSALQDEDEDEDEDEDGWADARLTTRLRSEETHAHRLSPTST